MLRLRSLIVANVNRRLVCGGYIRRGLSAVGARRDGFPQAEETQLKNADQAGLVGLRRRGFETPRIRLIQEAYRLLYRSDLTTSQAIDRIRDSLEQTEDIRTLVEFVETSERGIIKKV